jgi:hypothetical protein
MMTFGLFLLIGGLTFAGCVLIMASWVAVIDTWLRTEDDL